MVRCRIYPVNCVERHFKTQQLLLECTEEAWSIYCYALKLLCGGGGSLLLQQTSILWYDFAGGDIESHYLEIISHDLHT